MDHGATRSRPRPRRNDLARERPGTSSRQYPLQIRSRLASHGGSVAAATIGQADGGGSRDGGRDGRIASGQDAAAAASTACSIVSAAAIATRCIAARAASTASVVSCAHADSSAATTERAAANTFALAAAAATAATAAAAAAPSAVAAGSLA